MDMLYSAIDRDGKSAHTSHHNAGRMTNGITQGSHMINDETIKNQSEALNMPSAISGLFNQGVVPQSPLFYPMMPPSLQGGSSQMLPPSAGIFNLQCIACGLSCKTMIELHQHIMKKHLSPDLPEQRSQPPGSSDPKHNNDQSKSDFVIPKPNFAMMSSHVGGNANHRRGDPLLGVNMLHQMAPMIRGIHYPPGVVNPFVGLAYQNLLTPLSAQTLGSGVQQALTIPGVSPYFPHPSLPINGIVPGRFPYPTAFPGIAAASKESSRVEQNRLNPTQGIVEAKQVVHVENDGNESFPDSSQLTMSSQSNHAELIRRRMSAPLIGLNNRFMMPYNRNASGVPNFDSVPEQPEEFGQRLPQKSRRESMPDKSSRLNAKSIEKHICELISNNEKVLTNPVLERVKPRRVFRRNSLDPSSLSSYSNQLGGQNPPDRYDEDLSNKPCHPLPGFNQTPNFPIEPLSFSSGMSSAEYNKMIQLTRAPGQQGAAELEYDSRNDGILGKRSSSSVSSNPGLMKKARRSTFFECGDCGVRYRKEENYNTHKQSYCKFRKEESNFTSKQSLMKIYPKQIQSPESASSRHSVIQSTSDPTSSQDHFPGIQSITNNAGASYTKILPPFMRNNFISDPMKILHNDLCRTKSADAALQRGSGNDETTSSSSLLTSSPASDDKHDIPSSSKSSIPTNKLPPNKRHMHLMRSSNGGKDDGSQDESRSSPITDPRMIQEPSSTSFPSSFSEMSVPRSNYKLLLHQISLRNMQDIGRMAETSSSSSRRLSVDLHHSSPTTSEVVPRHSRSFSTSIPPSGKLTVPPKHHVEAFSSPVSSTQTPKILVDQMSNDEARKSPHPSQTPSFLRLPSKTTTETTLSKTKEDTTKMSTSHPISPENSLKSFSPNLDKSTLTLLYPHLQPSVTSRSYVTFCCILNPQPTCNQISQLDGDKEKCQLSAYSHWAVSEPIHLPSDLSITQLLNGWRKLKNGLNGKQITTNSFKSCELISTDNKNYKKQTDSKERESTEISPGEINPKLGEENPTIPILFPSSLLHDVTGVYTSCRDGVKSSMTSLPVSAHRTETLKRHSPTSSRLSDSDSDSCDTNFGGKVKRRRSRRERSAASPREQRRSLRSRSPTSPGAQAVHHAVNCSNKSDDRCALCNIKAGKKETSGHVTDSKPSSRSSLVTSRNNYLSPPARSSGYLDRKRASTGSTQHWVTSSASDIVFRYPSPSRGGEVVVESSGAVSPGSSDPDHRSPSLAEVVSEVIRSAALQRHNGKIKNRPFSSRRALVSSNIQSSSPGGDYILPWTTRPRINATSSDDKPWLPSSSCSFLLTPPTPEDDPTKDEDPSHEENLKNDQKQKEEWKPTEVGEVDDVSSEGEQDGDGVTQSARPFRCDECRVAFRIEGHLAKHLRSKGHTVAKQKKTLNRLKQQRLGMAPPSDQIKDIPEASGLGLQNGDVTSPSANPTASIPNQILVGTEVLAKSQVRALFEGNDEYACVPHDDVYPGDVSADDVSGISQDPRPFKCIACKVAFRFQGHLDRHFRSNLHLIAVGHYEQTCNVQHNDPSRLSDPESKSTNRENQLNEMKSKQIKNNHMATPNDKVSEIAPVSLNNGTGLDVNGNNPTKRLDCNEENNHMMAIESRLKVRPEDGVSPAGHALAIPL